MTGDDFDFIPPSHLEPLPLGSIGSVIIPPGWYDVDWFDFILNSIPGVSFRVFRESKKVTLVITDVNLKLRLNREVSRLLNLPKGRLVPKVVYTGSYDVNPFKFLFIRCPQLSTSENFFNGRPSDILKIVPVGTRKPEPDRVEDFKKLKNGIIDKLTFSISGEKGQVFNNKGEGIIIELEIF